MATNNTEEKPIKLTPSQQRAYDRFLQFLKDDTKVFILKGYAGTGKTTLLKTFINDLEKMKEPFKLLASTGRAAKIIRDITGTLASTIHSLLYVFKDLNQDLDKIYADVKEQPQMDNTGQLLLNFDFAEVENADYQRCFYIVDESSMVGNLEDKNPTQAIFGSGRTLHDLLNYDTKGKYIFVGDNCQLPPVNETLSPALSAEYIKREFGMSCMETALTDIMRQDGQNDIVLSAKRVRELYKNPPAVKWAKFPLRGYKNIKIRPSQMDLLDQYIRDIKENGYDHATLINRSNRECSQMSRLIRPALGLSGMLQKGDLLLVTQNNIISGLANGDMVVVTQVGACQQRAGLTFQQVEVEELVTKRKVSQLMITDILCGISPNITQSQQKTLFIDYFFRMKGKGIRQKSKQFKDLMLTDPFLNALRANYGYAITCHKAQGGEWSNVYLNMPRNISLMAKADTYQWLYTAMTRAKENLFVVEEFYLGN